MMSLEDRLYSLLPSYTAAPQWVKWSAGSAYSLLPRSLRYGKSYRAFQRDVTCPPDELPGLIERKLRETLHWALTTVPAYEPYRRLLAERPSPDELLQQLPLITKEELKVRLPDHLSTALPAGRRMEMFTGGATAHPMKFYLERGVSRMKEYAFVDEVFNRLGMRERDFCLVLRGRTVPTADQPGGRLWMYEPIKRHLILSSDHLEPAYMPRYVATLREWKPRFIYAFPSALIPLAKWLASNPATDVTDRIAGILLTSENVYEHQRALLRSVFACPILSHYGHSERVVMAATRPDDARYFFWPQYGHVELVDERGTRITEPGVLGEIVGTSYDNRAMPFVRYRTGDFAVWSATGRSEYRHFPVCERIEGRLQEFLVCADHRLVSTTTLCTAHVDLFAHATEIQYEQREPGRVSLKVVTASPLPPQILAAIGGAIEEKTQGGCRVTIQEVPRIERTERGKHRMVIQHLDIRRYLGAAAMIAA